MLACVAYVECYITNRFTLRSFRVSNNTRINNVTRHMNRTRGITEEQIREAIQQLLSEDQEPTTTTIRDVLGRGSFTTIGAVLAKWRDEQATIRKAQTPRIPKSIQSLFERVWIAAWEDATDVHEAERVGFRTERENCKRLEAELTAELIRVEERDGEQLRRIEELEAAQQQLQESVAEKEKLLAVATTKIESVEEELSRLRDERQQLVDQLTAASERAATAEALLRSTDARGD